MAAMHEYVHQRAGENQQVWQRAEYVGAMLGEKKEGGDGEKTDGRPFEARRSSVVMMPVVLLCPMASGCRTTESVAFPDPLFSSFVLQQSLVMHRQTLFVPSAALQFPRWHVSPTA